MSALRIVVVGLVVSACGVPPPQESSIAVKKVALAACGQLQPNEQLAPGQSVEACDGTWSLTLTHDGNLTTWAWSSGTHGTPARLVMQGDGNLVLYDVNGGAMWNTQTEGHPGAKAVLGDDFVLRVVDVDARALWSIPYADDDFDGVPDFIDPCVAVWNPASGWYGECF